MNQPAALYARVSSQRQKENQTIASQTDALIQYAQTHGYDVPPQWRFQDDGYSGDSLQRPGLEAVRDLAAEGKISAVLVYSPDRLNRKYTYQEVLREEFLRCGVQLVFLQSPSAQTPEDLLAVQLQGMIAEYERAQIAERTRRGKRHRAQQGAVSVLVAAPYGYRYIKKSESTAAYYQVAETEAPVVREIFDAYTREGLSLGAIARRLNDQHVPTRTGALWDRSTLWGMVRNPAYQGRACYGKTQLCPRSDRRMYRQVRLRGGSLPRRNAQQERPREDWIEIPVPALISEQTFALAQQQLEKNKQFASRRTLVPTLLQGMLVCRQCGYALCRTTTRSGGRTVYYYRCTGAQARHRRSGTACSIRSVRQDFIDPLVWQEILRLLEDPSLIQAEIQRRSEEARNADPQQQRQAALEQEQARLENNIDRLITAYQEQLLTLEQLRQRLPQLQQRQKAVRMELQSLLMAAEDQSRYLRVVETVDQFRNRLRAHAEQLDMVERQKILRLFVKEIIVGCDSITIRHSIPVPPAHPGSGQPIPQPDGPRPPEPQNNGLCRRSLATSKSCGLKTMRKAAMIDWHSNPTSLNYPDGCLNRPAFRRSELRLYGVPYRRGIQQLGRILS
jgi:site-specific DNA recombinase